MSIVALRGVEKSYGGRAILAGLDLDVEARARVGVVGANGSGKSTLLRILGGLEEPDEGEVARRRSAVVSLLPQHPLGDARTPLETIRAGRPDLARLEAELTACAERLGSPELAANLDRMAGVLRRQEDLLERYTAAGGPSLEGAPARCSPGSASRRTTWSCRRGR